jgi:hypothetical protein
MGGIENIFFVGRSGMFAAGTVAGLAGFAFKTPALLRIDQLMRILLERVVDIFVASPADFRSDIV